MIFQFPPMFWLQMIYFWICIFVAFYIPGNCLLFRQKVPSIPKIVFSWGIGMAIWGIQGLLFGYLHIRWMSYVYLVLAIVLWLRLNFPFHIPRLYVWLGIKKNIVTVILIFLGTFIQLSTIWFNGVHIPQGDYYCCGADIDNINHIAITQSLITTIPPYEPGLSTMVIKNYHYFGSVIVAELVRVFHLPLIATDFQYMTIFLSLLFAFSVIALTQVIHIDIGFANWLLFFLYFGGDFVTGFRFLTTGKISFDMSSLEDGSKFLANYPRAFAIDELFISLALLLVWLKQKENILLGMFLAMVMGSIISFKVYIGFFSLFGFFSLGIFYGVKRNFLPLIIAIMSLGISLCLYLPVNANAGGLYFTGFWLFENYITQPGFGLIRWELARTIYQTHHNYLRVISYEVFYILIYFVSLFWTKLLGLFQTKKSLSLFPIELHIFLIPALISSLVAGAFFQQSISGANTFNFLVSVFIIGSIYTALTCYYFTKKFSPTTRLLLIFCIVILTLPRVTFETVRNISLIVSTQGRLISQKQLSVFSFIREYQGKNLPILVDQRLDLEFDSQTPYVFVYTNKPMYLSGQVDDLDTHGVSYKKREEIVETLTRGDNLYENAKLLKKTEIGYVLTATEDFFTSSAAAAFISPIYHKDNIQFLQIDQSKLANFLEAKNIDTN